MDQLRIKIRSQELPKVLILPYLQSATFSVWWQCLLIKIWRQRISLTIFHLDNVVLFPIEILFTLRCVTILFIFILEISLQNIITLISHFLLSLSLSAHPAESFIQPSHFIIIACVKLVRCHILTRIYYQFWLSVFHHLIIIYIIFSLK